MVKYFLAIILMQVRGPGLAKTHKYQLQSVKANTVPRCKAEKLIFICHRALNVILK
jgi:hypothetical protein